MMIVRHPFERLVSAFREKLEPPDDVTDEAELYSKGVIGERIVKDFRARLGFCPIRLALLEPAQLPSGASSVQSQIDLT